MLFCIYILLIIDKYVLWSNVYVSFMQLIYIQDMQRLFDYFGMVSSHQLQMQAHDPNSLKSCLQNVT